MGTNSVANPILSRESQYGYPKDDDIVVIHCIHLLLILYQVESVEAKFANHADAHQAAFTPNDSHGMNHNSLSTSMRGEGKLCIFLHSTLICSLMYD